MSGARLVRAVSTGSYGSPERRRPLSRGAQSLGTFFAWLRTPREIGGLLKRLPKTRCGGFVGGLDDHCGLIPGVDRCPSKFFVICAEEFFFRFAGGNRIRRQGHDRAEMLRSALHEGRIFQSPVRGGDAVRSILHRVVIVGDLMLAGLPPMTQLVHEYPAMHAFFKKLLRRLAIMQYVRKAYESRFLIGRQTFPGGNVQEIPLVFVPPVRRRIVDNDFWWRQVWLKSLGLDLADEGISQGD